MIDAKELRIGNYIYEHYWNNLKRDYCLDVIKIKGIYETHVLCNEEDPYNLSDIKPIPLTEEILLKCGFEYNTKDWLELKYKNLTFNTDRSVNMSVVYLNVCNDWLEIEYLHQLQNLYFSLTKKELEVNL